MDISPVPLLDSILLHGLQAAEAAAEAHPQNGRNFRMIMAMLWSARDELDVVREGTPRSAERVQGIVTFPAA